MSTLRSVPTSILLSGSRQVLIFDRMPPTCGVFLAKGGEKNRAFIRQVGDRVFSFMFGIVGFASSAIGLGACTNHYYNTGEEPDWSCGITRITLELR
jgi:hypothetical protein